MEKGSFEFGFRYVNNELAKNSRQYETVPMYQFECWKEGQQLRFYESYVFEYIIFISMVYFLYSIWSCYNDLDDLTDSDALDKMKRLDKSMTDLVYMSFVFFGVPLHYLLLVCYYRLNRVRGRAIFTAQSTLDILIFILVTISSGTILPSFFKISTDIGKLDPSDFNLTTKLISIKQDLKNSHIWIFYSLFTGLTWLHVALSFRVSRSLGPLYKVLRLNFYDFMIWMTMIIITLSMFSVAGIMLSVDVTTHPCSGFKPCIIMYFEASMGSISFSEQVGVVAAEGLLIVCIIINLVLLFTVLIAMLTDSYEKIVSKAQLYFIKDIFEISRARKLDEKFGAFMSLDFPFTLFPGSVILSVLHCKYRNYMKETNEELRRAKLDSIKTYNNQYLKVPAFALAWIIISTAIFCVNIVTIPLVWLLIIYNEVKILANPDLVDMSKRHSDSSGVEYQELQPFIFEKHKTVFTDHDQRPSVKKNSRVRRFFSVSIWIFFFGLLIVAISTLFDTMKFCASFWSSQKSILANLQKAHQNENITFDRHQKTYKLNLRPRSVSSLATLAYQQLYENYERRNKAKNGEMKEELREMPPDTKKPGERTILLMRAHSFWRKQNHKLHSSPNTMKLQEFASKLEKELNFKTYIKEQNPSTLQVQKAEKPKDPFFSRANSIIPKSYLNDSGMNELSEKEVFRRLLLNFSVKRSKYSNINENLHTHQEINMETEEIFKAESREKSQRYLYLDCLVGIYSNLLILSKLEQFTKHPSKIPPSVRLNALDTLDRDMSEAHTLRAQEEELNPVRATVQSKFLDAQTEFRGDYQPLKRLPTAVRLEEGSYIKFYQIEGMFFTYRLQRLVSALCAYYSVSYRKKYTLGEIKKCSHYIAKVRKRNFNEKNKTAERLQTFQRAMTMSSVHSLERKYSATRSPGGQRPINQDFHLIPQEAEEDEKSEGSIHNLEEAFENAMSPRTKSPEPRVKESNKTAVIQTHRLLSDQKLTIQGVKGKKEEGKIAWDETARGRGPEPISDSKEELEFVIKR